ncbi:MAG: Uncharacterized protein FD145_1373 [Candidatus Saganbacteria bacterium]|uniref:SWIM-type domain-containing protein n=1 Tax=Candidatus Saganbacteria bacterium TaxID=2575572 RepID=A0A833NRH4_UNCSA|nr:MAG: Uncharacterized protein FD145_1373 [Candidatus Saganbacteria bacterium]
MGYWDWGFPRYVSSAEKKDKATKSLKRLMKKNPNIKPVILDSQTLAKTWWGKAWNKNLERYADYSNRIGRGRGYARHGAVLDLQINKGKITALVQGTRRDPYVVAINIKSVKAKVWQKIKADCAGKLDSLQDLLLGRFSQRLMDIFMKEGEGLFPTPSEIKFACDCPDWATMCKHVAAALYGVGARLDQSPDLFFRLRGIEVKELITETVRDSAGKLLAKAKVRSSRIIKTKDITKVFNIELEKKTHCLR